MTTEFKGFDRFDNVHINFERGPVFYGQISQLLKRVKLPPSYYWSCVTRYQQKNHGCNEIVVCGLNSPSETLPVAQMVMGICTAIEFVKLLREEREKATSISGNLDLTQNWITIDVSDSLTQLHLKAHPQDEETLFIPKRTEKPIQKPTITNNNHRVSNLFENLPKPEGLSSDLNLIDHFREIFRFLLALTNIEIHKLDLPMPYTNQLKKMTQDFENGKYKSSQKTS